MNEKLNISKKVIISSVSLTLLCSSLFAATIDSVKDFRKYPLPKENTSISRGGTLPDKIAATDGIGAILIGGIATDTDKVNNSSYNTLIKENLTKLNNEDTTKDSLNDLISSGDITISEEKLNQINTNMVVDENSFNSNVHLDGEECDDYNENTFNDIWINNICIGTEKNNITSISIKIQKYNDGGQFQNSSFKPLSYQYLDSNNNKIAISKTKENLNNSNFKSIFAYNTNSVYGLGQICYTPYIETITGYNNTFLDSTYKNFKYNCSVYVGYTGLDGLDIQKIQIPLEISNFNNSGVGQDNYQNVTFYISFKNNGITKNISYTKGITFPAIKSLYVEEINLNDF